MPNHFSNIGSIEIDMNISSCGFCNNSFKLFFQTGYGATPPRMRHNIEELFMNVKAYHEKEELSVKVNVQHDGLRPTLRSYQKRAVSWMLHKEGYGQKKESEGKL